LAVRYWGGGSWEGGRGGRNLEKGNIVDFKESLHWGMGLWLRKKTWKEKSFRAVKTSLRL
jgi:hypothetical protein